jgi:ABC-type branched-subunit amino acid transport system substrate-binding protein
MMKKLKMFGPASLFAVFSVALAVVPAAAAEQGITDTSIKLGTQAPMSGPVAVVGHEALGMKLKFDAVNAAGGVKMGDGKTRKIDFIIQDDANEPPRTVTNARRMVEQMGVFAFVGEVGTPQNQAIKPYLEQKHVPSIFIYSGIYEWGDESKSPWGTMLVPSFTTEAAIYARYLEQYKPDAKVGILYINTDFGLNFLDGFKKAIEGTKIKLVASQSAATTDPTVDTQLTNLKAAGADTLLVAIAGKTVAQAIRFAHDTGWNPLTFVTYAGSSITTLKAAGLDKSVGVLTGQFVKPVGSPEFANDPGVKVYLDDHAKFKPAFDKNDSLGIMGYVTADAMIKVLERTKQPTREALLASARNLNGVELGLLYPGIKLNTSKGDQFPIESMQLFRFDGKVYKPIGNLISYEGKTPKL